MRCMTGSKLRRSQGEVVVSRLARFVLGLALLVGVVIQHPARAQADDKLTVDFWLQHVAVIGDSYTTGTDEGGLGPKSWTARAWQTLGTRGVRIAANVEAEGKAGYVVPGDHDSTFEDLTARAEKAQAAFNLARRFAPSARVLVIGPPWPTADVPDSMLRIRDVLNARARAVGAAFVDPIGDGWFVDRPDLIGPDGVHPNDAGHEYLADKIAPLIRAQLSR